MRIIYDGPTPPQESMAYPWDEWLVHDNKTRSLTEGEDFKIDIATMRQVLTVTTKRRGLKATTKVDLTTNTIIYRVYNPFTQPKPTLSPEALDYAKATKYEVPKCPKCAWPMSAISQQYGECWTFENGYTHADPEEN